jgi:uncharacterized membrane protein YeaQ/YmgE (transglycosylase-associated protein family)
MGIIAWIVLGLIAGVLAKTLLGGRAKFGVIATILIGIGGALLGGWAASKFFHIDTAAGFFDLSTWIIAIIGSVVLRLTFHGITSGSRRSSLFRARR